MYLNSVIIKNFYTILHGFFALSVILLCTGCFGAGLSEAMASNLISESNLVEEYRLLPGDEIDIQVYREPQLSGTFRIDEAGRVRHPLCGSFEVEGLTTEMAEAHLIELLGEKYLVNPRVIVSIVSAKSFHVVILGEVASPGVHPFPFGESFTLLQAIAEAGGFSDLASVNRVKIVRKVDGKETSIRVRVSKLINGQEPDLKLKPNDVIMVPQIVF